MSDDNIVVLQCPYCAQHVDVVIDPDVVGKLVQDCEVCCNPWALTISRPEVDAPPQVDIDRAQ